MALKINPSKLAVNPGTTMEPLRAGHWMLSITGPPGVGQLANTPENNLPLRQVNGLETGVQVTQYAPNNTLINVPNAKSPNCPITLVYMLAEGSTNREIVKFWTKWRNLVYQYKSDLIGLYSDVIGTANLELLGQDGYPIMSVVIYEIWPSDLSIPSLNRDNPGQEVQMVVTLQTAHVAIKNE